MIKEWYTNILSDFNYECSRKDTFITRIIDSEVKNLVVFRESIKKKRTGRLNVMNISAKHMILENQFNLIRYQSSNIN